MTYFALILFLMLVLRTLVVHVNRISGIWIPNDKTEQKALVSLLIPIRNEAHNLPRLLEKLKEIRYPYLEIIICDDHSDDATPEILAKQATKIPFLNYFRGDELLPGWGGKNYACYQLAKRARGDFFLFIDADVILQSDAIQHAVSLAIKKKTALLSVFPQQLIQSKGEWLSVPLMNRILLSFLPLALVEWKLFPSLSAANGQFMLFRADDYCREQWHEKVKNQTVEDIQIARLIKQKGLNLSVKLGNSDIFCRMYRSRAEAISGFSRNIHQYFGGSRLWLSIFVLISWIRIPLLFISGLPTLAVLAIIISLINNYHISVMSRQSVYTNLLYFLPQQLVLTEIWQKNLKSYFQGAAEWKGRKIES